VIGFDDHLDNYGEPGMDGDNLSTRAPGDTGNAAAYVAMGRDEEGGE
jgi:hypothetical protein